jgi:ADP-heptose:LPS heptosyltransferase
VLSYELQRRYGGTIVIVGGPDERELAAEVVTGFQRIAGPRGPLLNLAGQTTLGSLGAAVSRFQVFITNDSGPAHIAYALDTPTVTVFGATNPARWGPPSAPYFRVIVNAIECWPCDYWVCPIGNQCLEGIPIETVFEAAEAVMAARSAEYRAQAPGA